jgi:hypothetical protein
MGGPVGLGSVVLGILPARVRRSCPEPVAKAVWVDQFAIAALFTTIAEIHPLFFTQSVTRESIADLSISPGTAFRTSGNAS